MCVLCGVPLWRTESQAAMAPSYCGLYGTLTPWDLSQVWWYTQGRLWPHQPPATSLIFGLLDYVMTPGSGGGGGESSVAAAQGYYHLKLIHAQVTVPAPPCVEHTVDLVEIDGGTIVYGHGIGVDSALDSLLINHGELFHDDSATHFRGRPVKF
ncbi:unnamed protein product [Schistocephalus solidus]|uniref:3D domain-containing protein n=1 Tax=Schistocephalus solidus TaxID=70667 RepID=A0A183TNP6_SCHSO|nr:unnamed protein product [Schistocephalus solidus]